MSSENSTASNRKRLLLIVAFFFVPLAIAAIWYMNLPDNFKPGKSTNNGVLIEPLYRVAAFQQATLSGNKLQASQLETVWTLIHLIRGKCDTDCSKSLYNTRQIRIALGKDIDRVNRVAVLGSSAQTDSDPKMWDSHPDMTFALSAPGGLGEQIDKHLANIKPSDAKASEALRAENTVYLIDPLGNVMMAFPPSLEPKLMMKDLRKLLKLSRIG